MTARIAIVPDARTPEDATLAAYARAEACALEALRTLRDLHAEAILADERSAQAALADLRAFLEQHPGTRHLNTTNHAGCAAQRAEKAALHARRMARQHADLERRIARLEARTARAGAK